MNNLIPLANEVAQRLCARKETVAVAESSTGGLISAALLAVPGASAYFVGGAVAYTRTSKERFAGITSDDYKQARAATEKHAITLAQRIRTQLGTTWGIGETGAAGPSGNSYGDPAGHTCLGVAGPGQRAKSLNTGSADRAENMELFAAAALELFRDVLDTDKR
jgi:nicotinamide-nucleotide amidase